MSHPMQISYTTLGLTSKKATELTSMVLEKAWLDGHRCYLISHLFMCLTHYICQLESSRNLILVCITRVMVTTLSTCGLATRMVPMIMTPPKRKASITTLGATLGMVSDLVVLCCGVSFIMYLIFGSFSQGITM